MSLRWSGRIARLEDQARQGRQEIVVITVGDHETCEAAAARLGFVADDSGYQLIYVCYESPRPGDWPGGFDAPDV
jgi:hypothetical protein